MNLQKLLFLEETIAVPGQVRYRNIVVSQLCQLCSVPHQFKNCYSALANGLIYYWNPTGQVRVQGSSTLVVEAIDSEVFEQDFSHN